MATDVDAATATCPTGDDLWFGWAAKKAGTKVKKLGGSFPLTPWPGSQRDSLWQMNEFGKNDQMLIALQGLP
jgi:hypothetical protein